VGVTDETARRIDALGLAPFSAAWWRAYREEHLRMYPDLAEEDPRSVRNLDDMVARAERLEDSRRASD
jgi:hypothetical protein